MRRSVSGSRRDVRALCASLVLSASLVVALVGCSDDDGAVDLSKCETVSPVAGLTRITIVGKNMAFDAECFQIEPGQVEFTFVNEDSSVSHNLHVSGPGGVNEATDLERGKITQVLNADLTEPGTYKFKCDPHPSTMKGNIVVADASSTTAGSSSAG